ncbi:anthrone oxygenase family protein [Marinicrinis sediminis]|uniref:DUF1772 domain-containing protein n=1 Tax=Marinicrinis sediminis TaxID=1652465 RepID=A0ABW5RDZ3_9BACL
MYLRIIWLAGILWTGIMAGFFWAFSFTVMPGLGATEPLAAMAAMQGINEVVRNAVFFTGFFGAPVLCILLIGISLVQRIGKIKWLVIAGGLIYLIGVFLVTTTIHVPMNEELALLDATASKNIGYMNDYIQS